MIRAETRREALRLSLAAVAGAVTTAAAVALLGLSGWFITDAALAGAAGAGIGFNFLLPSAGIRLFAILRTIGRYGERTLGHEAALAALARMRPQLFRALAEGPPDRALALSSGEASSRLMEDVDAIQTLFIRRSALWSLGAGAGLSLVLSTLAHPFAGVAVLAGMVLAVAGVRHLALRFAEPAGVRIQSETGRLKAEISALHVAAPELKAYGLDLWARDAACRAAAGLDEARLSRLSAEGRIGAWHALCLGLGASGAFLGAALGGADQPMAALAALAAITGVESVGGLAQAFAQRGGARAAVARLDEMTEPGPVPCGGAAVVGSTLRLTGLQGDLTPPLRLGISGPSGVGKTSLIERLVGLRPALAGEATLGGAPREELADGAATALFAYAAQDVRLIDGTVRQNLKLADPQADEARLWAALEDAGLADRLRAAPEALGLRVGLDGARLSGGERRRLGLARALLRDTPWLVLDEPTEGLDAETERRVLDRLDARLQVTGQGLILISHRPAPLALCHRVAFATCQDDKVRLALSAKAPRVRV